MKKPSNQTAISLKEFFVTKCDFVAPTITERENYNEELSIGIGFSTGFSEDHKRSYTVTFEVDIYNLAKDFKIHLVATSLFVTTNDITEDFKSDVLVTSSSPAIAFPFVRSYIHNLTNSSGMPSLILPAFNFTEESE